MYLEIVIIDIYHHTFSMILMNDIYQFYYFQIHFSVSKCWIKLSIQFFKPLSKLYLKIVIIDIYHHTFSMILMNDTYQYYYFQIQFAFLSQNVRSNFESKCQMNSFQSGVYAIFYYLVCSTLFCCISVIWLITAFYIQFFYIQIKYPSSF